MPPNIEHATLEIKRRQTLNKVKRFPTLNFKSIVQIYCRQSNKTTTNLHASQFMRAGAGGLRCR